MRRAVIALVLVAAGLSAGCGEERSTCAGFRFDRQAWAGQQPPERREIATALIECRTLFGKRRRVVLRTLGEPTTRGDAGWYWDLGPQREPSGLDNDQLMVSFDGKGRVKAADIIVM